jgi:hypothetical protein
VETVLWLPEEEEKRYRKMSPEYVVIETPDGD